LQLRTEKGELQAQALVHISTVH